MASWVYAGSSDLRTVKERSADCSAAYFCTASAFFARFSCSSLAMFSSVPWASAQDRVACAGVTEAPGPCAPLTWPASRWARAMRSAPARSISARSTFPAASAAGRPARGTAVRTSVSSFAARPHQRGLRVRAAVPVFLSMASRPKGLTVTLRVPRAPSLKASGVPMTCLG